MTKKLSRPELDILKKYTPGKPMEEVKREYNLTEVIKLASNENPLGPSPKAIDAIKNEAANVHIYPDGSAAHLREKLAEKLGVCAGSIMLGSGGEEIIKMIGYAFIDNGDEVIYAVPSFDLYEMAVNLMGGVSVRVPLTKDFEHDFEAFIEKVNTKTKIIFVCNPNNPTGNIMDRNKVEYLVNHIPEDVLLVLDEAYFEYAKVNPDYPDGLDILKKRPNTIIIRTFSKVAGLAGLRVGYLISSKSIIDEMSKVKNVFNSNRIAQAAAIAALDDEAHIDGTVHLNYESLEMMKNYFNKKGLSYVPSNANFIWVNVCCDTRIVNEALLKEGVIIRPGFLWGYDEYIRVSTGTIQQTEVFINKLDKVLQNNL